ncbi:uncharacterized protein OCT59_029135 [Rhizophagus irregularis]|uniref:uncharacterized protein n=1 Tax=Rhizophagus irregularis TaxID=588596 RepID=UPI0033286E61|nr:hypothetical protein OCT59_029135 [Rhizophagus irregularis]
MKDQLIGTISTFALDRIIGFVIVLLIDMNQLQLFALDHYQLRFLDIFVFSFGLVSWEVLKFGYFFGTLDDIGAEFLINIGRLNYRYDF